MRTQAPIRWLATSRPRLHAACLGAALVLCGALTSRAIANEAVTYLLPAAITQPAFAPWIIAKIFKAYSDRVYGGQPIPGRIDPDRLQALQEFYLRQAFIKRAVPVDELYSNDFVPAPSP
jgi:hypothetical protein